MKDLAQTYTGGSYSCTHDILFKMKMLSYLEVAYVFNNINIFIYQYCNG